MPKWSVSAVIKFFFLNMIRKHHLSREGPILVLHNQKTEHCFRTEKHCFRTMYTFKIFLIIKKIIVISNTTIHYPITAIQKQCHYSITTFWCLLFWWMLPLRCLMGLLIHFWRWRHLLTWFRLPWNVPA